MLYTSNPIIKYRAGLLNLAEELCNISKACVRPYHIAKIDAH